MPKYTVIQNQELIIDFKELLNDRGWELNGDIAIHQGCNVNSPLELKTFNIEPNQNYVISFTILEASKSPNLSVGFDTPLYNYNSPQTVTIPINVNLPNQKLTLWGTGYLKIKNLVIKKEGEESSTNSTDSITWSEERNRWASFRSYQPELGFSMFTDMFTYVNGQLWAHNNEGLRNNFYGSQYKTKVKFPTGSNTVKNFQSVAIHSNQIMVTTTDGITTSLGQVSDLIEADFDTREGIFYANFLRDKLTDLIDGDRLKGRFIVLELETVDGSKKLQLFKVVTKSSVSTVNE